MTILHETADCDRVRNVARLARLARMSPPPKPKVVEIAPPRPVIKYKPDKVARLEATITELQAKLEAAKKIENELLLEIGPLLSSYPSLGRIKAVIADFYHIPLRILVSARRTANITRPRQIGYFLCHELTPRSYPDIGRKFGNRDHTTILHGCRITATRASEDRELFDEIEELKRRILWSVTKPAGEVMGGGGEPWQPK